MSEVLFLKMTTQSSSIGYCDSITGTHQLCSGGPSIDLSDTKIFLNVYSCYQIHKPELGVERFIAVNVVDKEMIEDADNLQTCTVNNEMREEDEHTNSEGSDEVNNNYNDETQPDQSGKAIISLESVEVLP